MAEEFDYEKLGFRCGIEIHQQLEGKKLFCSCPSIIRKDKPHFQALRRLRASAGETGKIDAAAEHEAKKDKYFIYHGYHDTTCLVELDEEPPHSVNEEALQTALEVAKMLNCEIVDEIQFMRKTVVDGSNTSGFQRTALIGLNGWIEVQGKKIGIPTVCLEEEACQVIKRTEEYDIYNLSRLGIPLIEIATDPDITSPEEAEEAAAKIGMILRSTGKVKRGIGTIRQDVNLSIKGGARIEIKGFQDLKSIPKVIRNEIKRQLAIINQGKKVSSEVRKAEPDFTTSFLRPMPGADRMYPETDVPTIKPDTSSIKQHKLLDEKAEEWQKNYGIPADTAKMLVKKDIPFDDLVKEFSNADPKIIATTITSSLTEVRRKFKKDIRWEETKELLSVLNEGKISKDAIIPILEEYAQNGKYIFDKYFLLSDEEVERIVQKVLEENRGAPIGALMGKAMAQLKGKADGKKVMQLIQKNLKR
ncbi:Glu-tRNA(Gln) amidotransferase GatDE subunit E [Candidatus Woesearchaeota archaeon]|nr:MAG: Glu-tRNA(Gln) amidotransferase GatDE subunit E [Candidatus Woesearchaeota archaeon]